MDSSGAAMYYTYVETPVGPFFLVGDGATLSLASFAGGTQRRSPKPGWVRDRHAMRFAASQVEEYFAGERTRFELPLKLNGTAFQRAVWRELQSIPFGQSRSYGEIAAALGKPGASRAVGAANGANALPLIVPCHRVIGANGTLTGFGGGLETKRWLLDFEGVRSHEQRDLFEGREAG